MFLYAPHKSSIKSPSNIYQMDWLYDLLPVQQRARSSPVTVIPTSSWLIISATVNRILLTHILSYSKPSCQSPNNRKNPCVIWLLMLQILWFFIYGWVIAERASQIIPASIRKAISRCTSCSAYQLFPAKPFHHPLEIQNMFAECSAEKVIISSYMADRESDSPNSLLAKLSLKPLQKLTARGCSDSLACWLSLCFHFTCFVAEYLSTAAKCKSVFTDRPSY